MSKTVKATSDITSDQMTCRLGPAAAMAVGGGDDGVLQLLAPRRDGAVAPTAAAAAPHASAAVAAAVAPGRRAGEVRVGLVPGLDGAVGATVAEIRVHYLKMKYSFNLSNQTDFYCTTCCRCPRATPRGRSRTFPSSCPRRRRRRRRPSRCRSPSQQRSPPCSSSSPCSRSRTWAASPSPTGWTIAGRRATWEGKREIRAEMQECYQCRDPPGVPCAVIVEAGV